HSRRARVVNSASTSPREWFSRIAISIAAAPCPSADVELRHQAAILRHVADAEAGAAVARKACPIGPVEPDRALCRLEVAHDRAHQGGLAGTVAADHGAAHLDRESARLRANVTSRSVLRYR